MTWHPPLQDLQPARTVVGEPEWGSHVVPALEISDVFTSRPWDRLGGDVLPDVASARRIVPARNTLTAPRHKCGVCQGRQSGTEWATGIKEFTVESMPLASSPRAREKPALPCTNGGFDTSRQPLSASVAFGRVGFVGYEDVGDVVYVIFRKNEGALRRPNLQWPGSVILEGRRRERSSTAS